MNIPEEIRWQINIYNTHPLADLMKGIINRGKFISHRLHRVASKPYKCTFWPAYTKNHWDFDYHVLSVSARDCKFCKRIKKYKDEHSRRDKMENKSI